MNETMRSQEDNLASGFREAYDQLKRECQRIEKDGGSPEPYLQMEILNAQEAVEPDKIAQEQAAYRLMAEYRANGKKNHQVTSGETSLSIEQKSIKELLGKNI